MRVLPLTALVSIAALMAGGVAAAAPPPLGGDGEKILVSAQEALESDFRAVMEYDSTRDLADVKQDYETTVAIDGLNQELKNLFPGIFGFIKIVPGDTTPDAVVHLSGPAPAELGKLLDARAADLEVVVDQKMSQEQVGQAIAAVSAALTSASGVTKIELGYNYQDNSIEVFYNPDTALQESLLSLQSGDLAAAALAQLGLPQVPVIVKVDRSAGSTAELMSGGTAAGAGNGTFKGKGPVCTWGFTGLDRFNRRGILTAGHCTENGAPQTTLTYEDRYTMTPGESAAEGLGDAQFHHSSDSVGPAFVYERNQSTGQLFTRNLARTDVPDFNEDVCAFGWATKKQICSRVNGYDQSSGPYFNLVRTEFHLSTGGDSGGPWFYGPTGFGIHFGGKTNPPPVASYMLFSAITDVAPSAGVRLQFG
jgi:hypothetical protein